MISLRKHLSAPGLIAAARRAFERVDDSRKTKTPEYTMTDTLMSGLAIFGMKYPSLLQFDQAKGDPIIEQNLRNLYGVSKAPSDTQMRKILDPVNPHQLRPAFKAIFAKLQDCKALQPYLFHDDSYLLSVDGTGYFSSHEVHCDNCCVKTSRDGTTTYYHQMLGAVIVHPSQKQVIPLVPEPIIKQDGTTKNDCERNAAKRLLQGIRTDHPFLKVRLLGDGLFSNGPSIKLARELDMGFIFGAKPGDHVGLFSYLEEALELGGAGTLKVEEVSVTHEFQFLNDVPLNDANPDILVNFVRYVEKKKDRTKTFSWVTDIYVTEENVYSIMRGGRSRWRIENETFNTLKNQGYQFEHNFGHGVENLSTVFANLMLLAFLIDQAQELCCPAFRQLFAKLKQRKYMWERLRSFFLTLVAESWGALFECLIYGYQAQAQPNTS